MAIISTIAHVGFHIGNQVLGAIEHNLVREAVYQFNAGSPWLWPELPELVNAYYCGQMTQGEFEYAIQFHAVSFDGPTWHSQSAKYWWKVIDAGRPSFEADQARWLYYTGVFGPQDESTWADFETPADFSKLGPAEQSLYQHARRRGLADPEMLQQYLDGGDHLSLSEYQVAANRGLITDQEFADVARGIGLSGIREQTIATELRKEIPGPGDLVHFVLRHGFEPSVIAANKLDAEFPPSAREWLNKQGLGYTFQIVDPFTGQSADTTWADMYWQTHWVPISPSQAYTMLQRLRTDNIRDVQKIVPDATVFTPADLRRWLRINDYPPGIRANLEAISYNVIGIRFLRQLYASGAVGPAKLVGYLRDQGYSPADAAVLADGMVRQKQAADLKAANAGVKSAVKAAYVAGAVTRDWAGYQLQRLTYTDDAELARYDADVAANGPGQLPATSPALVTLQIWDLESRLSDLKTWTTYIRRQYLAGAINDTDAEAWLTQLGIQPAKQQSLITSWRLAVQHRHKGQSASTLLRWYSDRIIDQAETVRRLANLGYSNEDIVYMLAESGLSQSLKLAKQRQAAAKQAYSASRVAAAQIKAARAAARAAQKTLAGLGSPAKLMKWLKAGLIQEGQVYTRLVAMGRDPHDALRLIHELRPDWQPSGNGYTAPPPANPQTGL